MYGGGDNEDRAVVMILLSDEYDSWMLISNKSSGESVWGGGWWGLGTGGFLWRVLSLRAQSVVLSVPLCDSPTKLSRLCSIRPLIARRVLTNSKRTKQKKNISTFVIWLSSNKHPFDTPSLYVWNLFIFCVLYEQRLEAIQSKFSREESMSGGTP